jgi:hypothetical protein
MICGWIGVRIGRMNNTSLTSPPAGTPLTLALRRIVLVVPALVLAVALWWHPAGGTDIFAGVSPDAEAWITVHTAFLFATPLLGIAVYLLLDGMHGRAATVSRVALVFFLVFYTAYEVTVGVSTGVLVDYANSLPADEQAAVAGAIQDLNRNAILSDPSVSLLLGSLGWVVAMTAAAVAARRSGAGLSVTILLGIASIFVMHPPPVGPVGLACFAAAAVLLERARARAHVAVHDDALPATDRVRVATSA